MAESLKLWKVCFIFVLIYCYIMACWTIIIPFVLWTITIHLPLFIWTTKCAWPYCNHQLKMIYTANLIIIQMLSNPLLILATRSWIDFNQIKTYACEQNGFNLKINWWWVERETKLLEKQKEEEEEGVLCVPVDMIRTISHWFPNGYFGKDTATRYKTLTETHKKQHHL